MKADVTVTEITAFGPLAVATDSSSFDESTSHPPQVKRSLRPSDTHHTQLYTEVQQNLVCSCYSVFAAVSVDESITDTHFLM